MKQAPSLSHPLRSGSAYFSRRMVEIVLLSMALLFASTSARSLSSDITTYAKSMTTNVQASTSTNSQENGITGSITAENRAFLVNGRGGSTTMKAMPPSAKLKDMRVEIRDNSNLARQMENTIDNVLHGNRNQFEDVNESFSITAKAVSALASPPLRISTSQMGNEIVTNDVTSDHLRILTRKQKRERRAARKHAMKEKEDSHKVYARNLKVCTYSKDLSCIFLLQI